jgi:uncharacterized membrane protein
MNNLLNIYSTISLSLLVLFVPGFFLSFLFFDRGEIDVIERVALSFALSIAVIPLIVFYIAMFGGNITIGVVLFAISAVIWIAISVLMSYERKNKHRNH